MTVLARIMTAAVVAGGLTSLSASAGLAQDAGLLVSHRRPALTTHALGLQIGARDDDAANARNPALPAYERGMGQETGGPARMLIPG